jgi:hypothetical protein
MSPILRTIPTAGLLTWAFLALMFADAANLDDIFLSSNVLHDDTDLVGLPLHHDDSRAGAPQPGHRHQDSQRVIFDQDSPSLAAVNEAESFQTVSFSTPDQADPGTIVCTDDELHLTIRQLLI